MSPEPRLCHPESHKCLSTEQRVYPHYTESILPLRPRGRGPSSCSRRALTLVPPGAALGVRAPHEPDAVRGSEGEGGEGRVEGPGEEPAEGCEGLGDRSGYWEKSLYKGGRRGRSSELWRRTSEQSGAGRELRTVP